MSFGWTEIIIVVIIVLIIFGGSKKLPGLARSVGKSLREFKKAVKDVKEDASVDIDDEMNDIDKPTESVPDNDKSEENA